MTPSDVFIVRNPVAGGRRGRQIWPAIRAALSAEGIGVVEEVAQRPGHPWLLAEHAARAGYSVVAAAGGDGTIHEVLNGIMRGRPGQPPALAIIPVGTANIFVRELNLPQDPSGIAEMLRHGRRRRIDLGQVNDRYYATIAGIGFDAEVVHRSRGWPHWLGGKARHLLAALGTLPRYRAVSARVRVNGREERLPLYLLAAANTSWYGGGIRIAPHARVDDGRLSVVVLGDLSIREVFGTLRSTLAGTHLQLPKVGHTMAEEIRVDADVPLAIHADGEDLGRGPAAFRCIPGGLEVIVPVQA
ncbi:MAG: diacylglycerol/lipid kinase family protein [bacterium]